jgi:hypothetical protein
MCAIDPESAIQISKFAIRTKSQAGKHVGTCPPERAKGVASTRIPFFVHGFAALQHRLVRLLSGLELSTFLRKLQQRLSHLIVTRLRPRRLA